MVVILKRISLDTEFEINEIENSVFLENSHLHVLFSSMHFSEFTRLTVDSITADPFSVTFSKFGI